MLRDGDRSACCLNTGPLRTCQADDERGRQLETALSAYHLCLIHKSLLV